jgi:arylsulfatase
LQFGQHKRDALLQYCLDCDARFNLSGGLTVGADPGSPVSPEYQPPFAFTGIIHNVTVDVSGELIRDTEAEMRSIMARQ